MSSSAPSDPVDLTATLDAIWRIEGSRVVGTLARMTGDLSEAEDLAQEALTEVERLAAEGALPRSHLLPSVHAELLRRTGDDAGARRRFLEAAELAGNERTRAWLLGRADAVAD